MSRELAWTTEPENAPTRQTAKSLSAAAKSPPAVKHASPDNKPTDNEQPK
jgi:hypothetical protein